MKNKTDLLNLIKKSGVVRKFKNRNVPKDKLGKVLEAGKWGLSILTIQPWNFVCIINKKIINKIADITLKKSHDVPLGVNMIMKITSSVIKSSSALIVVYNTEKLQKRAIKYGRYYVKRAYIAELQAIGGAIQNMFLEINSLGLAAAWLDAPTFCAEQINSLLGINKKLIAFLALGYPDVKSRRSKRTEKIIFIK